MDKQAIKCTIFSLSQHSLKSWPQAITLWKWNFKSQPQTNLYQSLGGWLSPSLMKPRRVPKEGVTIWEAEWRSQKWENYHLVFPILRSIRARLSMPEVLVAWTKVSLPESCMGMDTHPEIASPLAGSAQPSRRCLSWGGHSDVTAPAHVIFEEPGECIHMEGGDENKKWCKWLLDL